MSRKSSSGNGLTPKRVVRKDGVTTTVHVRSDEGKTVEMGERRARRKAAKPKSASHVPLRLTAKVGSFDPNTKNKRLSVIIKTASFDFDAKNLDSQYVHIDGHSVKAEGLFDRFGLRLSHNEGDPLSGVYLVEGSSHDLAYFQEEFDDIFNYDAPDGRDWQRQKKRLRSNNELSGAYSRAPLEAKEKRKKVSRRERRIAAEPSLRYQLYYRGTFHELYSGDYEVEDVVGFKTLWAARLYNMTTRWGTKRASSLQLKEKGHPKKQFVSMLIDTRKQELPEYIASVRHEGRSRSPIFAS